ncbi:myocilin-like isoform X2 [Tachysurus fulvidraco]|uniref:myocilin-like isoform X2 n=1 Tax=Tachysurus fulvidraco TaxID=1234273 RepID=UPI001FEE4466|nr:myocilin-like isoform X2 [Tachysurus fulvidraco]
MFDIYFLSYIRSALITMSEVPVPPKVQENFQDNAACRELVSVGEPETHQKANSTTGKYGMWFQDPESPGAPYGPDTVWCIDTVSSEYHGLLYYRRRQSPTLLRYDVAAENIVARRELPHPGFHVQYPYSWGGYTDINLAVGDKGLWAIYSTEKARGGSSLSHSWILKT